MDKYGLGGKLELLPPVEIKQDSQWRHKTKLITPWDAMRDDFGDNKGDEQIIKQYWEQLSRSIRFG